MKKILLLSIVLFLGFGLIACGDIVDSNRADSNGVDSNSGESHELIGEWVYLQMTPWFRFYEDGTAINLTDGEEFTWYEDGSLNSLIYSSWSISDDTLTITWSTGGVSFNYTRAR